MSRNVSAKNTYLHDKISQPSIGVAIGIVLYFHIKAGVNE